MACARATRKAWRLGKNTMQSTSITTHVCGDITLNLYPHGKQVGRTLTHDHNYSKMRMKAESGTTFPTIVVQAHDVLTNDLNMEPTVDSILVIVWNGNDLGGSKKFEEVANLWYTAVTTLIALRRFWPRVVIYRTRVTSDGVARENGEIACA